MTGKEDFDALKSNTSYGAIPDGRREGTQTATPLNLSQRPDIAAYGLSEFKVMAIIGRVKEKMRNEGYEGQVMFDALFQEAMDDARAELLDKERPHD